MEYQILELSGNADSDTSDINEYASNGWELMQVVATQDGDLYAVLRRPR